MSNIIEINDLHTPGVEVFSMLSEAQLRNALDPGNALFIAESPKVIASALDAGCEPVALLLENKIINSQGKEIIARCQNVPIYTADEKLLTQITGFHLTRGAMCAMRRPAMKTLDEVCSGASRIVVIDSVFNVTNEGAIFRSAAALGMDAVLLTPTCCNPLNRRTVRVSMGTVFQIPWAFVGVGENPWPKKALAQLQQKGFKTVAMALTDNALTLDDPLLSTIDKVAIVMGTEGEGLSPETIAACDFTARIPMSYGVDSLNVVAASAVAFWQLRKKR